MYNSYRLNAAIGTSNKEIESGTNSNHSNNTYLVNRSGRNVGSKEILPDLPSSYHPNWSLSLHHVIHGSRVLPAEVDMDSRLVGRAMSYTVKFVARLNRRDHVLYSEV